MLKVEDLCHFPVWTEHFEIVFIVLMYVCIHVLDTNIYFTCYNFWGQILPVRDIFILIVC